MTHADPAAERESERERQRQREPHTIALPAAGTSGIPWWVLLVAGIVWVAFGLAVLQFGLTSARAIGLVIGLMLVVAAFSQLAAVAAARQFRVLHAVLAGVFFVAGMIGLIWPDPTFLALTRLVAWLLLFKGCANIVIALMSRGTGALWWFLLGLGVIEIGVAFWAAGVPSRSAVLLVLWVALIALTKGLTDIVLAFGVRAWERAPVAGSPAT